MNEIAYCDTNAVVIAMPTHATNRDDTCHMGLLCDSSRAGEAAADEAHVQRRLRLFIVRQSPLPAAAGRAV